MSVNALSSEDVAYVDGIDPAALTAGAHTSGWVSAKNFHRFMAVIQAGALGTSATLDAKIQQATDSIGTGAKDVTGKAITQLTDAGSDSNKQAVINLRPEELDTTNGFTYFAVTVTVATATSDAGVSIYGIDGRYGPASNYDNATVAEIV